MNSNASGLVDPAFLARLERLDLEVRSIVTGEFRGDVSAKRRGSGTLFREHKPYVQGDDPRFVDWNAYFRFGELFVKQFDSEEAPRVTVYIDASGSMDWGGVRKFDVARRIAAAIGYVALNRFAVVELVTLGGAAPRKGGVTWFGRARIKPFLTALDAMEPSGALDLHEGVRAGMASRRGRGLALVISDFFAESGYARALEFLVHAGFRVGAIQVLDPADLRPEIDGEVELIDLEDRRRMRTRVGKSLIDRFAEEAGKLCEGLERFAAAHELVYLRADTRMTLEEIVLTLIRRRGILR